MGSDYDLRAVALPMPAPDQAILSCQLPMQSSFVMNSQGQNPIMTSGSALDLLFPPEWPLDPLPHASQSGYEFAQPLGGGPSTTVPTNGTPINVPFGQPPSSEWLMPYHGPHGVLNDGVNAVTGRDTGVPPTISSTLELNPSHAGPSGDSSGSGNGLQIVQYGQERNARKGRKRGAVDLMGREPVQEEMKGGDGDRVQGYQIVQGNPNRKVKGSYGPQERENVAMCRKKGACDACRTGKRKCDRHMKSEYECCSECDGPSFQSPHYFDRQAVYSLSDTVTTLEATERPTQSRRLELSQLPELTLTVYVAKFDKQPGDKVNREERDKDGERHVLEMPHYCLTDLDAVRSNMKAYIGISRNKYLDLLRNGTDLTWLTTRTAMKYAARCPESMTSMALDMWAYCRVIEMPWKIFGEDTLGVERPKNEKSPWAGFVPVTPMMDVQLDQIVIQDKLNPLRKTLVARLDAAIKEQKPENWFDCYLCIYMLLNHVETAATHGNKFSKIHGLNSRYSDMKLAEAWFHSCKILLSRFHFISNGSAPFRLDRNKLKKIPCAKLDEMQLDFILEMKGLIETEASRFDDLRIKSKYECDLYWTHQLFVDKWDAGSSNIANEVLD